MPRVTSEGGVTIPAEVREALDLEPGDEVAFVETDDGYALRKTAPTTPDGADPFETYRDSADGQGSVADRMRRLRGVYPRPAGDDGDDGDGGDGTGSQRPEVDP